MQKARMRQEIYAMIPLFGPPTFFFTVNPADVYNPVCAFFAGADVKIGLRDPDQSRVPEFRRRATLVARDPVAAAQFFDRVARAFIRCLLGSRDDLDGVPVAERLGVLGDVLAHYAPSESQNRGTLHLHGLAWHAGALHPDELKRRLEMPGPEGDAFRLRVLQFWQEVHSETIPEKPLTDLTKRKYRQDMHDPLIVDALPQVTLVRSLSS